MFYNTLCYLYLTQLFSSSNCPDFKVSLPYFAKLLRAKEVAGEWRLYTYYHKPKIKMLATRPFQLLKCK